MIERERVMRNRTLQRQARKGNDEYISYYNHERYYDPTAGAALNNIMREERLKARRNGKKRGDSRTEGMVFA